MLFEFELALRFTVWSTTLLTAIITGHWAYLYHEHRVPAAGLSAKAFGWTVHQSYWFYSWLAFESDNKVLWQAIRDERWIIGASEAWITIATILVLSPYLKRMPGWVGRNWFAFGVLFLVVVASFGLGMAYLWQ